MKKANPLSEAVPPASNRLAEVSGLFLRLGFTAFGDPAAHIAMMRTEVVQSCSMLSP